MEKEYYSKEEAVLRHMIDGLPDIPSDWPSEDAVNAFKEAYDKFLVEREALYDHDACIHELRPHPDCPMCENT